VQHHTWVSVLGLDLAFRFDPLAWIMTLVVSGVGAAIVIYCAFYFPPNAAGKARFAATFTFFGGSMLGLVWSNHALMIYTFWELTSVFSFLLIGHHYRSRAARAAARQAFVVTTFGSLAMFGGFM
ncbi:Na+/H+ antiporter subunit A, partial [Bacillus cereus]|nr:Na+/H+ antiporter subunit A [Bacillus cereus]